jgi:hypothetical protein
VSTKRKSETESESEGGGGGGGTGSCGEEVALGEDEAEAVEAPAQQAGEHERVKLDRVLLELHCDAIGKAKLGVFHPSIHPSPSKQAPGRLAKHWTTTTTTSHHAWERRRRRVQKERTMEIPPMGLSSSDGRGSTSNTSPVLGPSDNVIFIFFLYNI